MTEKEKAERYDKAIATIRRKIEEYRTNAEFWKDRDGRQSEFCRGRIYILESILKELEK